MLKVLIKRLLQMILVLLIVSLIVFVLSSMIGDPVSLMVPENASPKEIQAAREYLGLDKPVYIQYLIFMKNVVNGNFGRSYRYYQPAMKVILERVPATLEIVLLSVLITGALSVIFGVYSGAYPKRSSSKAIMTFSIMGISLPSFWLGMMMIFVFSIHFGWLPPSGRGQLGSFLGIKSSLFTLDGLKHLLLPAITLSLGNIATLIRLIRAGMQETLKQDFIKYARSKGVSQKDVLYRHALPNTLIPVITIFGLQVGELIAFTTITETVFAWPGIGKLLIDSIYSVDKPIIVSYLMIVSAMFVVINFLVDIAYIIVDPRISIK
ncbi:MAG: ABC transporter permease [Acetomicrobium flavidum]|uniref:ABC transporter permease n=1 Tax=Acetomicrobium flavidum TaxID=49896 RepID=UPI0016931A68|nr:ABC transporter permease [Acetomicrobium flavidum]